MPNDIAFCFIGGEGTDRGNQLLVETADRVSSLGIPVYATHIAGKSWRLTGYLKDKYGSNNVEVTSAESLNMKPWNRGAKISGALFSGFKKNVAQALKDGAQYIVYSEGDKPSIADDYMVLADPLQAGAANVTLATRSKGGWNQFPRAQRLVESIANDYLSSAAGYPTDMTVDFLYGPKAFDRKAAGFVKQYSPNGWETIVFPILKAALSNLNVQPVEVPGSPQDGYLEKYPWFMRNFGGQLAWRTLQCLPLRKAVKEAQRQTRKFP